MKKILALILCSITILCAEPLFFGGLRNQRYAFVGVQFQDRFGIAFEESLFNQDFDWQHGRLALFSQYSMPLGFEIEYALFAGMQYDQSFYDYGSQASLNWTVPNKMIAITGIFQPMYDSDLGMDLAYCAQLLVKPFKDIGFYFGERNIPDFRKVEDRFFGGMLFELERISVLAEISTPVNESIEWTRVGASFIYKSR